MLANYGRVDGPGAKRRSRLHHLRDLNGEFQRQPVQNVGQYSPPDVSLTQERYPFGEDLCQPCSEHRL